MSMKRLCRRYFQSYQSIVQCAAWPKRSGPSHYDRVHQRLGNTTFAVSLTCAFGLLSSGCGYFFGPTLTTGAAGAVNQHWFVGGNEQRLLFAWNPDEFTSETVVVELDVESQRTRSWIAKGMEFAENPTDGRWLTWINWLEDGARVVMNLETGEQTERELESVLALDAGRLIAARQDGSIYLLDLADNGETELFPATNEWRGYRSAALWGPWLAIRVRRPTGQPSDVELPLLTSIELQNLSSGEHRTVIGDTPSGIGPLFFDEGHLVWTEPDASGMEGVRRYEIESGLTANWTTLSTGGDCSACDTLLGVSGGRLLVRTDYSRGVLFQPVATVYRLLSFDGESREVYRYTERPPPPATYGSTDIPGLTSRFVVFRHPFDGDFVIYDIESGNQQRFDPFVGE